jgi:YihY family inner membrane protein
MDPGAILERFLERPRVAFVRAVLDTYGHAAGGLLANGLAFAALFATIPIALVTLGLAGWLVGKPEVQAELAEALASVFPPLKDLIEGTLEGLVSGAALTSVIGLVGLIWTVSQFYVTLDVAFSRIFSDEPERDIFRRTARGFVWVALLIASVIVLIILVWLSSAADAWMPETSPFGHSMSRLLTSPPVVLVAAFLVMALVYRTVPPRAPRWSAVLLPAATAGVIIVVLSQVFVFLAPRLVGAAALAGSLATAFIALAWLSFTFQAVLYGASWVKVREDAASKAEKIATVEAVEPGSADLGRPAPPAEPGGGGQ